MHQHGPHIQGAVLTLAVQGWCHLHRQACCSQTLIRDSGLLWSRPLRTMDWIYSEAPEAPGWSNSSDKLSTQEEEDRCIFMIFIWWEGVLILILSTEVALNTWNWWLKVSQGQAWEQGCRSPFGAGWSSLLVRSPLLLRDKPHPPPRGNLSVMVLGPLLSGGRTLQKPLTVPKQLPTFLLIQLTSSPQWNNITSLVAVQ